MVTALLGSSQVPAAHAAPVRWTAVADTDTVVTQQDTLRPDSTATDSIANDSTAIDSSAADSTVARNDPPFPSPDAVFGELAEMADVQVIQYQGRTLTFDVEEQSLLLRREAQASYQGNEVQADTIAYSGATKFIEARGGLQLRTIEQDATSDSMLYYDLEQRAGTIMDARTSITERGAQWFLQGNTTPRGAHVVFVEPGRFTSCEEDHPHFFMEAGQIKAVPGDVILAWPVTFYIHDVPVAWLPFFAQDIRPDRRSGFLPPRFGINDIVSTSSGGRRSITDFGYYFALNRFMDAQATMDWFSGRFSRFNTGVRYRNIKKFFRGSVLASYSIGDERTFELRANHDHELSPVTNLRVSANYVTNTRVLERQSFDPTLQTQRIASDAGFQHRFPFASLNVSASRRQDLGAQSGRSELTLPRVQANFSPVTLFKAPPTLSGPFNNIVINGGVSATRSQRNSPDGSGSLGTRAASNAQLRLGSFGVGGRVDYNDDSQILSDSLLAEGGTALPATRNLNYNATVDYQVDLIGSTTLRPNLKLDGSRHSSSDTESEWLSTPSRLRIGASMSTDLYGFFPGFGPFERVRHKVSPRFQFDYSPAVEQRDTLIQIPGFRTSDAQSRLSFSLNQTFEAKLHPDVELDEETQAHLEGRLLEEDSPAVTDGFGEEGLESLEDVPEPVLAGPGDGAMESFDRGLMQAPGGSEEEPSVPVDGAPRRPEQRRNIVILGINSSPLDFDFSGGDDQPLFRTDRWTHRINSDLLRGLSLNMSLDLFEGVGEERTFAPMVSDVTGSFTFSSSGGGAGGMMGMGGGGFRGGMGAMDPQRRLRNTSDSRYRLQSFEENPDPSDPGLRGGGLWSLSLTYSLSRGRESENRPDRQSMNAVLSLNPTPNWSVAWRTSYNITAGRFAEHLVTVDRDLHRWMATFMFSRAPNGNFIFQMSVSLRDAPDLKVDYDQRFIDR